MEDSKDIAISLQAAIEIVDFECGGWRGLAKTIAKRLSGLPSAQLEPCEDAVSREKVFGYFVSLWECIGTIMDRDEWEDVCKTTANELPSAQPESENITFWEKRAREYEEMVLKLTDEIARGIKIDSVLITEEGIVFKNGKPEQRWIPVTERLPEDDVEVFVYLFERSAPYIAWVENCRWYTEDFEVEKENYPTAWMPLPEPHRKG